MKVSGRILSIDFLKSFAIVLMIYDHFLKYFYIQNEFLWQLNLLSPYASFLFLFCSGYLLKLSLDKANKKSLFFKWFKRKFFRSLILIGLSWGLLLANTWLRDITFSLATGILQTIGFAQLIGAALLFIFHKISNKALLYALFSLSILILFEFLFFLGVKTPFLTTGAFPLLPYSTYFFFGMSFRSLHYNKHIRTLSAITLVSLLWVLQTTPLKIFNFVYVYDNHYLHSFWLSIYLMCLTTLLYFTLQKTTSLPKKLVQPIIFVSNKALEIYVGHILLFLLISFFLAPK